MVSTGVWSCLWFMPRLVSVFTYSLVGPDAHLQRESVLHAGNQ